VNYNVYRAKGQNVSKLVGNDVTGHRAVITDVKGLQSIQIGEIFSIGSGALLDIVQGAI
jgi:hypothetical protein